MTIRKDLAALANPRNVRFSVLLAICRRHFGKPRKRGSHYVFTTTIPPGIVNIQSEGSMAKDYQVRQVIAVLEQMEG